MKTDPETILAEEFGLPHSRAVLISQGNNTLYRVEAAAEPFALKLTKPNFRPRDAYEFETALAAHWAAAGCKVPRPVKNRRGHLFSVLDDGRTAMLLSWLDGVPFDADIGQIDASDLGAALGELHMAGQAFQHSVVRSISVPLIIADRRHHLIRFLGDDPGLTDMFQTAIAQLEDAYSGKASGLPSGAVHGDAQYANAMRCTDGTVALFDLDTCGNGVFIDDIATFVWRAELDAREVGLTKAFLAGYETVRPLTEDEQSMIPYARLGRDVVMACTYAWLIEKVGPVSGFDVPFSRYCDLVRRHSDLLP